MQNTNTPLETLRKSIDYRKGIIEVFPNQEEVLTYYDNNLKEIKNVAIEMPTGSGKSFVLLAIAEYWRKNNKKVCVLAQNKQLTDQLKKESDRLKFDSVLISKKTDTSTDAQTNLRKYSLGESFGITNYASFFTHDIGADILIFDDSHLIEDSLNDHFTIKLLPGTKEFEITREFLLAKKIVDEKELEKIKKSDDVKLVDFTNEKPLLDFVSNEVLSKVKIEENKELYWSFLNNRKYIKNFMFFISKDGFFLTPFIKPLSLIEQVEKVPQRVFLSATIPSKNQFILGLGLEDDPHIVRYLNLKTADYNKLTIGSRLVLAWPNLKNSGIEDPLGEYYNRLANISTQIIDKFDKVLILCRSLSEMHFYESFLKRNIEGKVTIYTQKAENFYNNFKEAKKAVLLLANRYSGLDFPDESCRVTILPTIPSRCTPVEIFIEDELKDTSYSEEKTAMRIVQALGRCNRNSSDIGIYFVLAGEFYLDFNKQATYSKYYPTNVMDEVNFGIELYAKNNTQPANLINLGQTFIEKPQVFQARKLGKNMQASPDEENYNVNLVRAWRFILNNNYNDSTNILSYLVSKEKIGTYQKRWWSYLIARCLYSKNNNNMNEETIANLEEAAKKHETPFFTNLQSILLQNQRAVLEDSEEYKFFKPKLDKILEDKSKFTDKLYEVKEKIETEEHDKICGAVSDFLKLLGIRAENISSQNQANPDLEVSDIIKSKGYIIEVKSKPEAETITSADIAQIKKHIRGTFEEKYSEVTYIILSKKLRLEKSAESQIGGIKFQYIEDYSKLIDNILILITKKDRLLEEIMKFYKEKFSNLT